MDVLQAVVGGSDGCLFSYGHAGLGTLIYESCATSKARGKLNSVNFRKDFWDRYYGQGKNWPIDDLSVPSKDPTNSCGTHFGLSPLSALYILLFCIYKYL